MVHWVKVGLPPLQNIPPPVLEEFPETVHQVMFGLLELQYIPPPLVVEEFPEIVHRVRVGLLLEQYTPPPLLRGYVTLPWIMVKPSTIEAFVSPLWKLNPRPFCWRGFNFRARFVGNR